jgi:hypothetical protein
MNGFARKQCAMSERMDRCCRLPQLLQKPIQNASLCRRLHDIIRRIAAELYKKGVVSKILVSQVAEEHLARIGVIPRHSELNRKVLRWLDVPDTAVEMFGQENGSTRDEAYALREWADRHPTSLIVVPTEIFSSRRVQWIFNREFNGASARFQIVAVEPHGYARGAWWESAAGLIAFQNEIMKYLYYRLRY